MLTHSMCMVHVLMFSLTVAWYECDSCGSARTEIADSEGSDHYKVLGLSLESRYLSSGVCLSGDNDGSIWP